MIPQKINSIKNSNFVILSTIEKMIEGKK